VPFVPSCEKYYSSRSDAKAHSLCRLYNFHDRSSFLWLLCFLWPYHFQFSAAPHERYSDNGYVNVNVYVNGDGDGDVYVNGDGDGDGDGIGARDILLLTANLSQSHRDAEKESQVFSSLRFIGMSSPEALCLSSGNSAQCETARVVYC